MSAGRRAVVLGGSVAGICAAGVLSKHFDEVVVYERDVLPDDVEHRRGVPQSRHPHFLLNSGRRAMDTIFPGFENALIDAGGLHLQATMSTAHCEGGGWIPRTHGGMTMIYASRILVERVLRGELRHLSNVRIEEGAAVTGLQTSNGGQPDGSVTGVYLSEGRDKRRLEEADLIIDALGRGSQVADWLHAAGWPEVLVKSLDAGATYSSRWYQKPDDLPDNWWWHHLSVMPTTDTGPHPESDDYLCQIFPIESDRVLVTLGSWGHPMPRTEEDFVDAVHRVRSPAFGRAVDLCEPLTKVFVTRSTGNKWRRYDLMDPKPNGIVSIGDAICGFNPLYGQGMSSAARSALMLGEKLSEATDLGPTFTSTFAAAQAESLNVPWTLALARDQGCESAEGTEIPPRWLQRLSGRLAWPVFNLISGTTREDPVVEEHFTKVFNLDEPVTVMVRSPRALLGLARYATKKLFHRTTLPVGFDPLLDPPADVWIDGKPTPGGHAQVLPAPGREADLSA